MKICFVCMGNICRSPTAEGVMQAKVDALDGEAAAIDIELDSAGTGGWHRGQRADDRARAEALRRGIDLTSRARQVHVGDFAYFDLLIAMDRANRADLLDLAPDAESRAKVRLLLELAPSAPTDLDDPRLDVPDPYYGGPSGFADVFDLIDAACDGLLAEILALPARRTCPLHAASDGAGGTGSAVLRSGGVVMDGAIGDAIGEHLGVRVRSGRPVGGGDSSDAWRVELDDDTVVFAKTDPDGIAGLFASEADGLRRLAATGAIHVPQVLAVVDTDDVDTHAVDPLAPRFIVLGWIEPGRPHGDHDDELGRSLAALHRATAPRFGLEHDNHLGRRPQINTWCDTWAELYGRYRLEPIARLATDAGVLSDDTVARIERLMARLPELLGPPEPPALVHGDLWAGNALVDSDGRPWLIDPAVSYSHREIDLAMMRLFGGFGPAVFSAYAEAFPPADGWAERVELLQLYYLLLHTLHPSPAGYVGAVDRILRRYT